jgi:hypothetical protein
MPNIASVLVVEIALVGVCAYSAFCAYWVVVGNLAVLGAGWKWPVLAGIGAGVLTLGFRLCLAQGQVSWAPYADQWHAEIFGIVSRLVHGELGWRDLVAGNNEHRVLLTRVMSLDLTVINGGWDNRVLVFGNYLLESFMVAWACMFAWSLLGWLRGSVVCAAALLPMFLVCDWEAVISSNQTQFVFMAFGTVIALSLTQSYSLGSTGARGALAVALVTLGSMASGLFTAMAMAATGLVYSHVRRRGLRSVAGFGAACLALAAIGWLTRVQFTALHSIYAKDARDWLAAFLAYAAWPLPPNILGFLGLWLPWALFMFQTLRRREMELFAPFAVGLGFWALLQAAALAFARAGLEGLVSSRYTEFLSWGTVANAAALVLVLKGKVPGRRISSWALIALWLGGVGGTEIWQSNNVYRPYMDGFREQTREHERRLGTFMRTGDASVLESVSFPRIPYYSADQIISTLRDPQVVPMLPAPLRRDAVRDVQPEALPTIHDGPLSFAAIRIMGWGPGCAILGVALLLGAFLGGHRQVRETRSLQQ